MTPNLVHKQMYPLAQADQASQQPGVYYILKQGSPLKEGTRLAYVGQTDNLRRRLMEHRYCLTHLRASLRPYRFGYTAMPGSSEEQRRKRLEYERHLIRSHKQRGGLTHQRQPESDPDIRITEAELAQAATAIHQRSLVQPENFAVQRVLAIPRPIEQPPRFRVVGASLSPMAARTIARQMPGVFVTGARQQARAFAARIAADIGGRVEGPEHHGAGLSHFHVIHPNGTRLHIWYGWETPRGEFML